jgi:hypothetical protein
MGTRDLQRISIYIFSLESHKLAVAQTAQVLSAAVFMMKGGDSART